MAKKTVAPKTAKHAADAKFVAAKGSPIKLGGADAKVFKECQQDHVWRVGKALVGFERASEGNEWQSRVIVSRGGKAKSIDFDDTDGFQGIVVAPSGERFIILDEKAGGMFSSGSRGQATEVELKDLSTRIATTALDHKDDTRLAAIDYLDDDTLVAGLWNTNNAHLVLLQRDRKSKAFVEIHRDKANASHIATDGRVIAIGAKNVTLFGVVDRKLVKLGKVTGPKGGVYTRATDSGREIWAHDTVSKDFRLTGHEALTAAAPRAGRAR